MFHGAPPCLLDVQSPETEAVQGAIELLHGEGTEIVFRRDYRPKIVPVTLRRWLRQNIEGVLDKVVSRVDLWERVGSLMPLRPRDNAHAEMCRRSSFASIHRLVEAFTRSHLARVVDI